MRNDGATTIVERDETVLEAVEETVSNLCNYCQMLYCKHGDRETHKGWAKKVAFFSANFRRQYLGNCLSDLLKNLCAKSPH